MINQLQFMFFNLKLLSNLFFNSQYLLLILQIFLKTTRSQERKVVFSLGFNSMSFINYENIVVIVDFINIHLSIQTRETSQSVTLSKT